MKLFKFKFDSHEKRITLIIFGLKITKKFKSQNDNTLPTDTYHGTNLYIVNPLTKIGKYCSIGNNVSIGLQAHCLDFLTTHPLPFIYKKYKAKTTNPKMARKYSNICDIGNDVWIGNNVSIIGGLSIGNGAVLGTGAVVTKDVPPYAIMGGVPAKLIRYRFSAEIIEKLENLKWWDFPVEDLKDLPFDNVEECIKILQSKKTIKNINRAE